jgi:hypothetical protein
MIVTRPLPALPTTALRWAAQGDMGDPDEALPRSADDAGKRRRGQTHAYGVVQIVRSPERTGPGRTGTLVWTGDTRARMASAIGLLAMRLPRC